MQRLLLAVMLAVPVFPAMATERLREEAQTLALSNRMMETAMKKSPEAVFAQLKPYWPLDPAEIDGLASTARLQWQIVESRFGKPLGYELVATERIGHSFVRYVYLQKFENHALRWVFGYYKPKDSWLTNAFKFDDQLDQLYEED